MQTSRQNTSAVQVWCHFNCPGEPPIACLCIGLDSCGSHTMIWKALGIRYMKIRVVWKEDKLVSIWETVSFTRTTLLREITKKVTKYRLNILNPLKPELNPICYLLALLAHHFLHVCSIRVKSLTIRLLMSYIYGAPILDVSRSHTTTQHSR